ncbi:MAG: class I SAM-dependent methyltransferase, partial [Candidatus Binatia bacterium]
MSDEFTNQPWLQNLTYNVGLLGSFRNAQSQLQFILNQANLNENAKIIDLGSGYAPFLYHCRQKGFNNLYALEPSKEICHYLEGQGIVTYPILLETFITQDDLPQFDLIVLSQILENLIEPADILCGLRRLLSENGVLFIEVPYGENHNPHSRSLHLHFFNETSMAHLLTRCGYRTMLIHPMRHNFLEVALIKTLRLIHGETYFKKRT